MRIDDTQRFHEIAVAVASNDVDPITNYITENICGGLLLEDLDDERTVVKFYVPDTVAVDKALESLARYMKDVDAAYTGVAFERKFIQSTDWIEAYKKSVTPILVGDSILVKPPWNRENFAGRTEIIIEPKMAFGTGRHESTRGCLAHLERLDLTGKRVLDVGCGSGILSIYAARRGAGEVIGCDTDPIAVENSSENFILNRVELVCRVIDGSIDKVPPGRPFDIVVVNIIKSVILSLMDQVKTCLTPDGIFILAGLLEQDRAEIDAALEHHGLSTRKISEDNGWLAYMGSPK